jgi:hypothetical protein
MERLLAKLQPNSGDNDARWGIQLLYDIHYLRLVYGLKIDSKPKLDDESDEVRFEGLGLFAAQFAASSLRWGLAKYPPSYIRDSGSRTIRLVDNLRVRSASDDKVFEHVGGCVTNPNRNMYISPASLAYDPWGRHIHRTFDHELEHNWEKQESAYEPHSYTKWVRYMPEGAASYLGRRYEGMSEAEKAAIDATGFAIPYGRLNYYEDRATVAELLMSTPKKAASMQDATLAMKVAQTKDDFAYRSRGLMSKAYFADLARGKSGCRLLGRV